MFGNIASQISKDMEQLLASTDGPATSIVIHWDEPSIPLPVDYDPNDEDTHVPGATVERKTLPVRGVAHMVNHATTTYQRFAEVQTGDVILELSKDVSLEGKENISFEIDGTHYTQKPVGKSLTESWALLSSQGAVLKSHLLTPAR